MTVISIINEADANRGISFYVRNCGPELRAREVRWWSLVPARNMAHRGPRLLRVLSPGDALLSENIRQLGQ